MAKFVSKLHWGEGGVDWDERINFARMREARLAKAKLALKKNGVKISTCAIFIFEPKIRACALAQG